MSEFILQLPSQLCITGPKILANLHATVWEFLGVVSRSKSANR